MVTLVPEEAETSAAWWMVAHESALTDRPYHGVSPGTQAMAENNARVSCELLLASFS